MTKTQVINLFLSSNESHKQTQMVYRGTLPRFITFTDKLHTSDRSDFARVVALNTPAGTSTSVYDRLNIRNTVTVN